MGPPPRQNHHSRSEKSLTLAPLQQASAAANASAADTQSRTLEAMILSIPILNKVKVLARICAPLAASPPSSPTAPTTATASTASAAAVREQTGKRGLVIAIDAADPLALKQLTRTLAFALQEHDVKVMATPRPAKDVEPSFQSYLRLVEEYHTLSAKIKEHITTPAAAPKPLPRSRTHASAADDAAAAAAADESPVSPKSFPNTTPPKDDGDKASEEDSEEEEEEEGGGAGGGGEEEMGTKLPIAILPAWQLTHTDAFACAVEIADRYSPIDHWQWGATVWRGVIGADITIAVKADVGDDSPVKSDSSKNGERDGREKREGGKAGSVGRDAGVEVRLDDFRAVVVKGESEGGVAEGGLRRVGFEVGEWVRGIRDREERRRREGSRGS